MNPSLLQLHDETPELSESSPEIDCHLDMFLTDDHLMQLLSEDVITWEYPQGARLPLQRRPYSNESLFGLHMIKDFTKS